MVAFSAPKSSSGQYRAGLDFPGRRVAHSSDIYIDWLASVFSSNELPSPGRDGIVVAADCSESGSAFEHGEILIRCVLPSISCTS